MQKTEANLSDETATEAKAQLDSTAATKARTERKASFRTVSLDEINRLYAPADVADVDFEQDINFPGQFPYTRGIHATGYREVMDDASIRRFQHA